MWWLAQGVNFISWVVGLVALLAALVALLDAALRPGPAYEAAGKLTKPGWLVILGVAFAVLMFFPVVSFFGPFALVAVIVYLVDVRPAVRAIGGGRNSRRPGPPSRW